MQVGQMLLDTPLFRSNDEQRSHLFPWKSEETHHHGGSNEGADLPCQIHQRKRCHDDYFSFSKQEWPQLKRRKFSGFTKSFFYNTVLQGTETSSEFWPTFVQENSLLYPCPSDIDKGGNIPVTVSMSDISKPKPVVSSDKPALQSISSATCGLFDAATLCQELEFEPDDSDVEGTESSIQFFRSHHSLTDPKPLETVPMSLVTSSVDRTRSQHDESKIKPGIVRVKAKKDTKADSREEGSNTSNSFVTGRPMKFDILCGQSKNLNHHTGNRRFQVILDIYASKYRMAPSRSDRTVLTKEIIECVHSSGGRFLRCNKGVYEEISQVMARDKISHALRNRI